MSRRTQMRKSSKIILLSAAATGASVLAGQGGHVRSRAADAATVNHELRIIVGLQGTESNVAAWGGACNPGEYYWHAPCYENPLDNRDINFNTAHLTADFEAQQLPGLAGAPLRAHVSTYGITSSCLGVRLDIFDDSTATQLGSLYYVHIEGSPGLLNPPAAGYDIPINGADGAWTIAQLGDVHGDDLTPGDGYNPDGGSLSPCGWTGPHLHQGGSWTSGHGARNSGICNAYIPNDCIINPTGDALSNWIHAFTWSTFQPDPTPTPTPIPTTGSGGWGKLL